MSRLVPGAFGMLTPTTIPPPCSWRLVENVCVSKQYCSTVDKELIELFFMFMFQIFTHSNPFNSLPSQVF